MRRELTTRAGAAAMARAEGRDGARLPASDDDIAHETSPGKVTSSSSSRPSPAPAPPRADAARAHASAPSDGLVLPDEVVMRILRHVLEDGRAGDARRWSVGGRFRVRARRPSSGADDAPPVPPARAPLREVCKQWRRLLDATCTHLEARRAVVFGDDELVGLASLLGRTCARLTLEGSHLLSGRRALTSFGLRDATARLPALVVLDVRRTGMELAEIFHVASQCANLREVRIVGAGKSRDANANRLDDDEEGFGLRSRGFDAVGVDPRGFDAVGIDPSASPPSASPPSRSPPSRSPLSSSPPSSSSLGPWESAVLHDVPSGGAALSELARLLRAGPPGLEELSLAHLPNLWRRPKASRADEEETSAAAGRRAGVCAALVERTSLRALRLRDVGLDDAAAADVVRSLPSTLEELRMEGEGVGARATGEIARALAADAAPGLWCVAMPRRGVGARAATELDVAMARRRASGRALFARLVDDDRDVSFCGGVREIKRGVGFDQSSAGTGAAGTETGTATLARRFLARWTRRRGASRSKRVEDDGELRLSADAPADPNEEEMDDDDEEIDEEIEDALRRWTPRAVARDVLSHLARREAFHDDDDDDVETNETTWKTTSRRDGDAARTRTMTPSPSRPMTSRTSTSPRTSPSPSSLSSAAEAWSVAGPGASEAAHDAAAEWFARVPPDDSLRAVASRVVARDVFFPLALRLVAAFRGEGVSAGFEPATERASSIDPATERAFARVVSFAARRAKTLGVRFDERVCGVGGGGVCGVRGGGVCGVATDDATDAATDAATNSAALSRAFACAALPVALAAARPDVPSAVLELAHEELCARLVAADLVRRVARSGRFAGGGSGSGVGPSRIDARRRTGRGVFASSSADAEVRARERDPDGSRADSRLVRALAGGAAWAAFDALGRWVRGDADHSPPEPHALLSPAALPSWIAAGAGPNRGGGNDDVEVSVEVSADASAAAAALAAAGVRALVGHEGSLGDAGLRSLARTLAAAARTQPKPETAETAIAARRSPSRPSTSPPELHEAVRELFSRRKFAPLRHRAHALWDDDGIASWPRWLHAIGAPPPLDPARASEKHRAFAEGAAAFARLEAEAASTAAKMARLGASLRAIAADVRVSAQFHREPARALLRAARDAVGWRFELVDPSDEIEHAIEPAPRRRQARLCRLTNGALGVESTRDRDFATSRDVSVPGAGSNALYARRVARRPASPAWREEATAALDALFAHVRASAPYARDAPTPGPTRDEGWSLPDDAADVGGAFSRTWECRAAAATLAWYADGAEAETRAGDGMGRVTEEDVEDALRVLGVSGDGHVAGGVPVWSALRLRRGARRGTVELDRALRRNLLLDLDDEDEGGR